VYIHKYLAAWKLYMNCRCYQIILGVKHLYTNPEKCKVLTVDWIFIIGVPAWQWDWANRWHWTKYFTIFFSNRKWQQLHLLRKFISYRISQGSLY